MNILMLDTRNVEQTKDVRMYIGEFILVDLDTSELNIEVKMHGKILFIYTRNKGLVTVRNVRIALRSQLTSES